MEKKWALIVGAIVLYMLLMVVTHGAFKIILILGLIAYGMYKFG